MNEHKIKTIEVFSDIVEENGVDNWNSLYQNKKNYFKTILSCYSFTEDEMKELDGLSTYDQLLNTVGRGVQCDDCAQKETELYDKYYPKTNYE